MTSFESFGIIPPTLNSPAVSPERCNMAHEEYTERAFAELQNMHEFVVEQAMQDLDAFPARWHPSGFMVYQLGVKPELGMLRLHVWPEQGRKVGATGDTLHDHAWHVASLVLKGVYHDELYKVVDADAALADHDTEVLCVLDTGYAKEHEQSLFGDGSKVKVEVSADRHVPESELHSIEPAIFHKPIIPLDQAVVTLVFLSFRTQEEGPFVLTAEHRDFPNEQRPEVTPEDRQLTQSLFE